MVIRRGEVYLVELDPTVGSEIRKTRPAVVISPDEMNEGLHTVIVAPMTSRGKLYASRIPCQFQQRHGAIALDQIRTIDVARMKKKLGSLPDVTVTTALSVLVEMFTP